MATVKASRYFKIRQSIKEDILCLDTIDFSHFEIRHEVATKLLVPENEIQLSSENDQVSKCRDYKQSIKMID